MYSCVFQFKYKRRVYKLMQLNPRKLKQLHTKANLKQFMESVRSANIDRIQKFTIRGLDPNFHESDSGGETKCFGEFSNFVKEMEVMVNISIPCKIYRDANLPRSYRNPHFRTKILTLEIHLNLRRQFLTVTRGP